MIQHLTKFKKKILDMLFPLKGVEQKLDQLAQKGLLHTLPPPIKEAPVKTSSLFYYKDRMVRALVWQIKYKRNSYLALEIGKLLYEQIIDDLADKKFFETADTILAPIPISPKKRRQRGHNQSEIICEAILQFDLENMLLYDKGVLKKLETPSQTSLRSRKLRLGNIKGSLQIIDISKVANKNVILIDDVVTTGATMAEAKRLLMEAGAKKVYAYTIAH